jgi:glycosyltransferase involved in cell wall biosynthesis
MLVQPEQGEVQCSRPLLSVVIAARNEEAYLGQCLDAVVRQLISVPYEIIVIDNASSDSTPTVASTFPCTLIYEPWPDQLAAKHTGVVAARGDIIVILDADCIPDPCWLANIYLAMSSPANRPSGVTCCYRYDGLPWWGYIFVMVSRLILVSGSRLFFRSLPFVIGGNTAFWREGLLSNGGYPRVGGIAETELGVASTLASSGPVRYLPSMKVQSSARRFRAGPASFLIGYKLRRYLLPLLRRTA